MVQSLRLVLGSTRQSNGSLSPEHTTIGVGSLASLALATAYPNTGGGSLAVDDDDDEIGHT
jgi:hypothetical protein